MLLSNNINIVVRNEYPAKIYTCLYNTNNICSTRSMYQIIHAIEHRLSVVSSYPAHGEVHSIPFYLIKFAISKWFSSVSFTKKTDHNDMTEILLKVAYNTTTLTQTISSWVLVNIPRECKPPQCIPMWRIGVPS